MSIPTITNNFRGTIDVLGSSARHCEVHLLQRSCWIPSICEHIVCTYFNLPGLHLSSRRSKVILFVIFSLLFPKSMLQLNVAFSALGYLLFALVIVGSQMKGIFKSYVVRLFCTFEKNSIMILISAHRVSDPRICLRH